MFGMSRALGRFAVLASLVALTIGTPAYAQEVTQSGEGTEPDRIRGLIRSVENSSMAVKIGDGTTLNIALPQEVTVLTLTKASFTDVDFGVYVGSVSTRLDAYSPIIRDSMSWLHEGFELRIFDEKLRGLALGHTKWDLTSESVMTHGWVDDLEVRILSIKYGPTEEEETDVDVPRDVPILKLSIGDKSMIKPDAHVFAGAQKDPDGNYVAVFVIVGDDGIVPPL